MTSKIVQDPSNSPNLAEYRLFRENTVAGNARYEVHVAVRFTLKSLKGVYNKQSVNHSLARAALSGTELPTFSADSTVLEIDRQRARSGE